MAPLTLLACRSYSLSGGGCTIVNLLVTVIARLAIPGACESAPIVATPSSGPLSIPAIISSYNNTDIKCDICKTL